MNKNNIWLFFMKIGAKLGCHQRADRSFFIKKRQFPVCARCTGVIIGYIIVFAAVAFYILPIWACLIFCFIMFVDWLIQFIGIRESSNLRRLITGILGGCGVMSLEVRLIITIFDLITGK